MKKYYLRIYWDSDPNNEMPNIPSTGSSDVYVVATDINDAIDKCRKHFASSGFKVLSYELLGTVNIIQISVN